jgi:threonine dehydrogenase-like Zn-dependent dehydrogenase
MAEYMRFPADALNYKVPASVPVDQAVYIEPLACAIHAVQRGNIEFQDVVVIAGWAWE